MIVNFDGMKAFLPSIVMKGHPGVFDDAIEIAQDALRDDILGADLMAQIDVSQTSLTDLKKMCQRIVSLDAFISCIHDLDLVLTDAGFAVIQDQDMAVASKERVQNLKLSLQDKLDSARDRLVTWLMATSQVELDWRGTEQFSRLADGLFLTFADFRDRAVLNNVTATAYPKTWSQFMALNGSLNVALMTDAASYISPAYAAEILEKIKDNEPMLAIEKKVVILVKIAIAAKVLGDGSIFTEQILKAVAIMKANAASFPTFIASKEANVPGITHSDTPIFSLL